MSASVWISIFAVLISGASLTWNVHSTRADRAYRREQDQRVESRERQAAEEKTRDQQLLMERNASLVMAELRGGGGHGTNGGQVLTGTSVNLVLTNNSERPALDFRLDIRPSIQLKAPHQVPNSLQGGERFREPLETHNYRLPQAEASGRERLSEYVPVIQFVMDGETWRRVGDGPVERLSAGAPPD